MENTITKHQEDLVKELKKEIVHIHQTIKQNEKNKGSDFLDGVTTLGLVVMMYGGGFAALIWIIGLIFY